LGRLLRRLVLFSAPLSLAVVGAACGGISTTESGGDGGTTSQAGTGGGASGGGASDAGAGGANKCLAYRQENCVHEQVSVLRSCLGAAEATVDKLLPDNTCNAICGQHTSSDCSVVALDATMV